MIEAGKRKVREPLFHITKRASLPWWHAWIIRGVAILAALVVCGVLTVLVTDLNPLDVYRSMFEGAFGSETKTWVTMRGVAILLCISLAVTPAFRMRFWNTGAEGQVLAGGIGCAACMIYLTRVLPNAAVIPLMLAASIAMGVLWAVIPAIFRAGWNTNETLFTLMMNYVAMQLIAFLMTKWESPKGSGTIGVINLMTEKGWLPTLFGNESLLPIIVVAVLTVLLYIYLQYSKHGYEISVVGESENTARYIGINVKKVIIRTMALSGAICGLAGLLLVGGSSHSIDSNLVDGRGFTAIMVSWLAKFDPFTMILTTLLLVFLARGADEVTSKFGLNSDFSEILTGIILFFIIGCEFFINYQVHFNYHKKEKTASAAVSGEGN